MKGYYFNETEIKEKIAHKEWGIFTNTYVYLGGSNILTQGNGWVGSELVELPKVIVSGERLYLDTSITDYVLKTEDIITGKIKCSAIRVDLNQYTLDEAIQISKTWFNSIMPEPEQGLVLAKFNKHYQSYYGNARYGVKGSIPLTLNIPKEPFNADGGEYGGSLPTFNYDILLNYSRISIGFPYFQSTPPITFTSNLTLNFTAPHTQYWAWYQYGTLQRFYAFNVIYETEEK